jgi:ABC-type bacteriocin/lantibiotic exporter with double-glycine peptidase domain
VFLLPLSWLIACAAALAHCQATAPSAHRLAGVPFVRQHKDNWCGPSALASVLAYHGHPVRQEELAQQLFVGKEGALNLDLKLCARRLGFAASSGQGQLCYLKHVVASGVPVICQVRRRQLLHRYFHYLVVYGYDDRRRVLYAHAGTAADRVISYRDFDHDWSQAGRWMLTIRAQPGEAR